MYRNLISVIAVESKIDASREKIKARYIIKENASPIVIHNNMGVKFYLDV